MKELKIHRLKEGEKYITLCGKFRIIQCKELKPTCEICKKILKKQEKNKGDNYELWSIRV